MNRRALLTTVSITVAMLVGCLQSDEGNPTNGADDEKEIETPLNVFVSNTTDEVQLVDVSIKRDDEQVFSDTVECEPGDTDIKSFEQHGIYKIDVENNEHSETAQNDVSLEELTDCNHNDVPIKIDEKEVQVRFERTLMGC